MNTAGFLMRYDAGGLKTEKDLADGFQKLLNNGQIWRLEKRYINAALNLIDTGLCYAPGLGLEG